MNNQTRCWAFPSRSRAARMLMMLIGIAFIGGCAVTAGADDGPRLNKTTVQIDILRGSSYWPPGAAKEVRAWSWIPHVTFKIWKPVPSGSRCSIAFTKPDGSTWLDFPCHVSEVGDNTVIGYETPTAGDLDAYAKKYTTAVGTFGFKISLHDELGAGDQVLLSGKFKVGRVSRSQGTADTKNDADYYVDHDWALPVGYVWFAPGYAPSAPSLRVSTWLRGPVDLPDVGGYLYYQGKLVGSTKGSGGSLDHQVDHGTSDNRASDPHWGLWDMCFGTVRKTEAAGDDNPNLFIIDKNPGEYEVKMLRKGELCRDLKFTVGDDGKVVDTGIGDANHMGTTRIIVPVKVMGTLDGPWKAEAWKTDAFYGNPLAGFAAP